MTIMEEAEMRGRRMEATYTEETAEEEEGQTMMEKNEMRDTVTTTQEKKDKAEREDLIRLMTQEHLDQDPRTIQITETHTAVSTQEGIMASVEEEEEATTLKTMAVLGEEMADRRVGMTMTTEDLEEEVVEVKVEILYQLI